MENLEIRIKGNEIRFIYSDKLLDLKDLGTSETKRASFVEPSPNDDKWYADMNPVNGPILGPFDQRDKALEAEVAWLLKNNIPTPN